MLNNNIFGDFIQGGAIRHGLPPRAYRDEQFLAAENDQLFSNSWIFVAFAHEMPNCGDVIPVTVAGRPILLVRGEEGKVRAFHNVCRHRCVKLVDEPCNKGRKIRCPYHSWVYDLDGALKSTPYFGGIDQQTPEGFNKEENGLVAIKCEIWYDWVFVRLTGQDIPFGDFIEPIINRLEGLDLNLLKPVATLDFGVVDTNWKFLMENFIEPYHVQFVHSTTTEQPLADHYVFTDRHCIGSGVELDINRPQSGAKNVLALDSNYYTLFPNFVLATYAPAQLGVHLNTPISAGKTSQRRVIYLLQEEEISPEKIDDLENLWFKVHKEDHEICEKLQAGRASTVADQGGWLSPKWETGVRRFQELVYEAVSGNVESGTQDSYQENKE